MIMKSYKFRLPRGLDLPIRLRPVRFVYLAGLITMYLTITYISSGSWDLRHLFCYSLPCWVRHAAFNAFMKFTQMFDGRIYKYCARLAIER